MSYKIAIASGKGGTGKTTIAVNLYHFIQKYWSKNVQLVDCDVEEPNDAVFFPKASKVYEKKVYQKIPFINTEKCNFCSICADFCEYNAIVIIPSIKFAEVNSDLCHSCGACYVACQFGAIKKKSTLIGFISEYATGSGNGLIDGKLKVGSAMQTLLIKQVKKNLEDINEIVLFDAPPGTSCPVVTTVHDADYVILVTEPTPFGLHDLKLTIDMLRELSKPHGVIINKSGLGDCKVHEYLKIENIDLLGQIPYNKDYASKYAIGDILNNIQPDIEKYYHSIISKLKDKIVEYA